MKDFRIIIETGHVFIAGHHYDLQRESHFSFRLEGELTGEDADNILALCQDKLSTIVGRYVKEKYGQNDP